MGAGALGPLEAEQQAVALTDELAGLEGEQLPRERIQLCRGGADGQEDGAIFAERVSDLALPLSPAGVFDKAAELLAQTLDELWVASRQSHGLQISE